MNALRTLAFSIATAGLVAAGPAAAQAYSNVPVPPPPVAAQPAAAQPAAAQDVAGSGWNTQYGMLFTLQNVFTQPGIVGGYGGGVGVQYNLGPTTAFRFTIDVARQSDEPTVSEHTVSSGTGSVTTKTFNAPSFTSKIDTAVSGMYLVRLGTAALAPYLGGGVSLGYSSTANDYKNDIDPANVSTVNNVTRSFGVGLAGQLGLEWRVHRSISLFAEYGLDVTAIQMSSTNNERTALGTTTKDSYSKTTFFSFNTGLEHGGQLGMVAFF